MHDDALKAESKNLALTQQFIAYVQDAFKVERSVGVGGMVVELVM
jgi:hypothetical protein